MRTLVPACPRRRFDTSPISVVGAHCIAVDGHNHVAAAQAAGAPEEFSRGPL